jgi:hypothetical protein
VTPATPPPLLYLFLAQIFRVVTINLHYRDGRLPTRAVSVLPGLSCTIGEARPSPRSKAAATSRVSQTPNIVLLRNGRETTEMQLALIPSKVLKSLISIGPVWKDLCLLYISTPHPMAGTVQQCHSHCAPDCHIRFPIASELYILGRIMFWHGLELDAMQ